MRQVIYSRDGVNITSTPVEHYTTGGPSALRVDWNGLSFVYSGGLPTQVCTHPAGLALLLWPISAAAASIPLCGARPSWACIAMHALHIALYSADCALKILPNPN